MREFSTPLTIAVPATGNLTDDVVPTPATTATSPSSAAAPSDGWVDVTAAEFLAEVSAVAKGLVAAGVEVGDRVALLSKTRYEWTLFDYAIWFAGAVIGADLRDLLGRADRLDPRRTPAPARSWPRDPTTSPACARPATPATSTTLQHVWSIEDNAVDVLRSPRLRHLRRRPRAASYDRDARWTSPR